MSFSSVEKKKKKHQILIYSEIPNLRDKYFYRVEKNE